MPSIATIEVAVTAAPAPLVHETVIRPWDGPAGKVYDARCACGWRGPSISTHYFIGADDAQLAIYQHERQVEASA